MTLFAECVFCKTQTRRNTVASRIFIGSKYYITLTIAAILQDEFKLLSY